MKALLSNLSHALLKFHRELLFFQTSLVEKSENRSFTPYELLHLSLNDARFSWLRKFSEIIIQIDIITDDKEDKPFDSLGIVKEVKNLITSDANADFSFAMKADPSLMLSLGGVRTALNALDEAHQATAN